MLNYYVDTNKYFFATAEYAKVLEVIINKTKRQNEKLHA